MQMTLSAVMSRILKQKSADRETGREAEQDLTQQASGWGGVTKKKVCRTQKLRWGGTKQYRSLNFLQLLLAQSQMWV